MKRLLFILLFCSPMPSIEQTVFIINSYQLQPGGATYDTDASTYFIALIVAGTTPTTQQKDDLNTTYYVNGKSHGWYPTRKAAYFPVWSNASANAINMVNPGTYNLTFFNSPSHTSSGVAWNGTSQYANTGLAPNAMSQNSFSMCYYSQTSDNSTKYDIGCSQSATSNAYLRLNGSSFAQITYFANSKLGTNSARTNTLGLFTISITASNAHAAYRQGSSLVTGSNSSLTPSSEPIYIGAVNFDGSPFGYSTHKWSYSDIGDGLSSTDEGNHYSDVQALHTAFGIAQ